MEVKETEGLIKELLTGQGFLLKKVFTTKDVLRRKLKNTQTKPLKSFQMSSSLKVQARLDVLTNSEQESKTIPSISACNSVGSTQHFHTSPYINETTSMFQNVVFVVPYKILLINDGKRQSSLSYAVLKVTDLNGTFAILVVRNLVNVKNSVGELWAVLDPHFMAPQDFHRDRIADKASKSSRFTLSTDRIVRIGILSGFNTCLYVAVNGRSCGLPFYNWEQLKAQDGAKKQTYCARHNSLNQDASTDGRRSMKRLLDFHAFATSSITHQGDQIKYLVEEAQSGKATIKRQCPESACEEIQDNVTTVSLNKESQDQMKTTDDAQQSAQQASLSAIIAFAQYVLNDIESSVTVNEGVLECQTSSQDIRQPNLHLRISHFIRSLQLFTRSSRNCSQNETKHMR